MNTLVMLQGGHTTLVKGQAPHDIEHQLRQFDQTTKSRYYIQAENHGDNGLILDPRAVVALVAAP